MRRPQSGKRGTDRSSRRLDEAREHLRRGDFPGALARCRAHLERHPDEVPALLLMGTLLGQSSQPGRALPFLTRAARLEPGNAAVRNDLGLVHLALGDAARAREAFETATGLAPRLAPAHFNLARLMMDARRLDAAERHYREAIACNPDFIDAMAGLAELLAHGARRREAADLCRHILSRRPDHAGAALVLSNLDFRARRFESGRRRLDTLLARGGLDPTSRSLAEGRRAQCLEALGDYDAAFAGFRRANEAVYEAAMAALGGDTGAFSASVNVARLRRHFTSERVCAWPRRAPPGSGDAPVFLLGFPRSGTTLLDRMLASHPGVLTLEERDCLGGVYERFGASEAALHRLDAPAPAALRDARRDYWDRVGEELDGTGREGRLVVDKLPLNTILLGFIARIFPDARVVLAVRDPRDVCLSCYQQRFELNPAMLNFLRWDRTVAYYDAVMGLGMQVLEAGTLAWHRNTYEDLVEAPRAALRPLLAFLGLPWDDAVLDYRALARERYTSTPSAEQVVRPVYRSSIGRFRHYEQWLTPGIERLAPWVERFGYEA